MVALLLVACLIVTFFCAGVIVGIWDCKRKFAIPKSAVGVDENGFIYS